MLNAFHFAAPGFNECPDFIEPSGWERVDFSRLVWSGFGQLIFFGVHPNQKIVLQESCLYAIYIYIYIYVCVCDCMWLEIFPIQLCCKTRQFSKYIVEIFPAHWNSNTLRGTLGSRLAPSIRYTTEGCATFFKTTRFKRLDKAIFDYDKLSQQELGSSGVTKHDSEMGIEVGDMEVSPSKKLSIFSIEQLKLPYDL